MSRLRLTVTAGVGFPFAPSNEQPLIRYKALARLAPLGLSARDQLAPLQSSTHCTEVKPMATRTKRTDSSTVAIEDTPSQPERRQQGPSLNRVSLIGRLTADPQLRYTSNGTAVTNFRIANNGTDGVQFHTVMVWRRLAEIAAEYLAKGRLVFLRLGPAEGPQLDRS